LMQPNVVALRVSSITAVIQTALPRSSRWKGASASLFTLCVTSAKVSHRVMKLFLSALTDRALDEELTYDYKFEREWGSDDRIPCLCGTTKCKGFLN